MKLFTLPRKSPRRGFTLLELIVVITIIGLLGTLVVVSTRGMGPRARATKIDHDLKKILDVAEMLFTDTGRYPESIEEMVNPTDENGNPMVAGLKEFPKDPWGNPYEYEVTSNGQPRVWCLGSDGTEGGEGEAEDKYKPEQEEFY